MATNFNGDENRTNPLAKIIDELHPNPSNNTCFLPVYDDSDDINKILEHPDLPKSSSTERIVENEDATNSGNLPNLLEAANTTGKILLTAIVSSDNGSMEDTFSRTINQPSVMTKDSSTQSCQRIVEEGGADSRRKNKKHIMISYSRTCKDQCIEIRKYLESKNYIVWMDLEKVHGKFIDAIAEAIENSYIGLVFLNRAYLHSYWCKREAQFFEKQNIECIPCYLEQPLQLEPWLDMIIGRNNAVDFTEHVSFEEKMTKVIKEITHYETGMSTPPRRSLPNSPIDLSPTILPSNSTSITRGEFNYIVETFQRWVQDNRESLRRTDQSQVAEFVKVLLRNLRNDDNVKNLTKDELLKNLSQFFDRESASREDYFQQKLKITASSMFTATLFCLFGWALQTIYES